jgi:hypothetical protein
MLLSALRAGDRQIAEAALSDLHAWVKKGGVLPRDPRVRPEETEG